MAQRKRFFTMYLTTTISVALVLFLVGMEGVILLSSRQLMRDVKENITLSVVLNDEIDSTQIQQLGYRLEHSPYCHSLQYVSKEEALADHIASLGEDPEKFLGYNPLSNSYEVKVTETYAVEDSIKLIVCHLEALPEVNRVYHPEQLVSVMNIQLGRFSLILAGIALLLLLISTVLIVNTVRLHVYSKRFIIRTMRLVGATTWVIRAPFVRRNLRLGLEASVLALMALAGVIYGVHEKMGFWFFELDKWNIGFMIVLIIGLGEILTLIASLIATGKYIRMKTDKLYEI